MAGVLAIRIGFSTLKKDVSPEKVILITVRSLQVILTGCVEFSSLFVDDEAYLIATRCILGSGTLLMTFRGVGLVMNIYFLSAE